MHRLGLFSSRIGGDSSLFFLTQQGGEPFSIIHYFPVNEPFMISTMEVWFLYRFCGLCICFSFPGWDSDLLSNSSGCVFSRCFSVEIGAVVFPTILFVVVPVTFWAAVDSYWVVLAMIGPRTTQGSDFLVQAVNCLFCCMYAVVGLRTELEWGWELGLLDKLGVFGSHIDRARGLVFFSITPE